MSEAVDLTRADLTREEILDGLKGLLREVLDLEGATAIEPATRLRENLHIDSLGMLDVVIGVENTFGVKLSSDLNLFEKIATVDDAVTLIQQARSAARQG